MNGKFSLRLLATFLLTTLPPLAEAQQPKVYRIGMLVNGTSSTHKFIIDEFRQGLRELGYWEGKNVDIQYRYAEGKLERLPELTK
jgi:putative tryptophan/tyrosine transport system substrate-binding protein